MFTPRFTPFVSILFGLRMLGLAIIFPVFAVAVHHYPDATPQHIGLALGVYGLTQACLQIPLGFASDKWGRKPILLAGLGMLALGSWVAAISHTLWGITLGRALQGTGAIGSTLLALLADATPEDRRARAMATVGMCIGLSFGLAFILGPMLYAKGGLKCLFFIAFLAAIAGIVWTLLTPFPKHTARPRVPLALKQCSLPFLLPCLGILSLHAALTSFFLIVPHALHPHHPWLYAPIFIGAFLLMTPFLIVTEKKKTVLKTFFISAWVLIASILLFAFTDWKMTSLLLFFSAFSLLEALLPSYASKQISAERRGIGMGFFSSCQFLGIFAGGSLGGLCLAVAGLRGVVFFAILTLSIWLSFVTILARSMKYAHKGDRHGTRH